MKTTIVKLLQKELVDKFITVYELDRYHNLTQKRISHYFSTKEEMEEACIVTQAWKDPKLSEINVKIINVDGYSDPYEGNSIFIYFKIEDKEISMSIDVDKEMEII